MVDKPGTISEAQVKAFWGHAAAKVREYAGALGTAGEKVAEAVDAAGRKTTAWVVQGGVAVSNGVKLIGVQVDGRAVPTGDEVLLKPGENGQEISMSFALNGKATLDINSALIGIADQAAKPVSGVTVLSRKSYTHQGKEYIEIKVKVDPGVAVSAFSVSLGGSKALQARVVPPPPKNGHQFAAWKDYYAWQKMSELQRYQKGLPVEDPAQLQREHRTAKWEKLLGFHKRVGGFNEMRDNDLRAYYELVSAEANQINYDRDRKLNPSIVNTTDAYMIVQYAGLAKAILAQRGIDPLNLPPGANDSMFGRILGATGSAAIESGPAILATASFALGPEVGIPASALLLGGCSDKSTEKPGFTVEEVNALKTFVASQAKPNDMAQPETEAIPANDLSRETTPAAPVSATLLVPALQQPGIFVKFVVNAGKQKTLTPNDLQEIMTATDAGKRFVEVEKGQTIEVYFYAPKNFDGVRGVDLGFGSIEEGAFVTKISGKDLMWRAVEVVDIKDVLYLKVTYEVVGTSEAVIIFKGNSADPGNGFVPGQFRIKALVPSANPDVQATEKPEKSDRPRQRKTQKPKTPGLF